MSTIAITGATGFVGTHLRGSLEAAGPEVRPLSVRSGVAPADVSGAAAVIHLAGEPVSGRWTAAKRARILDSRRNGTRAVVDAIAGAEDPPRVLLSASAVGFYGDRGDTVLTEDQASGNEFLSEVCRVWEAEAARATEHGVRVASLRFGLILARDGEAFRRLAQPARLGLGGPMGSGRQWWPWVHIDDVVGVARAALAEERYSGPVNVTAPAPERQRDVARTLGRVLHRPAVVPAPAFALKLLLGGFAAELLASRRALPAKAQSLGYDFVHPVLEPALEDLTR
ncbi:MAG: uncharacterized protein QOE98_227 [Gaiellaceae bacterium]|nr:uncharacterized protein [Gaiellaceae bacterium]